MCDLFVLLHEITRRAAARAKAILAAVSCQAVLGAYIAAIHQWEDPGEAYAGQGCEASALSVISKRVLSWGE